MDHNQKWEWFYSFFISALRIYPGVLVDNSWLVRLHNFMPIKSFWMLGEFLTMENFSQVQIGIVDVFWLAYCPECRSLWIECPGINLFLICISNLIICSKSCYRSVLSLLLFLYFISEECLFYSVRNVRFYNAF